MTNNYSPSVNIVRDLNKQIEYIQTPNTIQLYNQILSNYRSGVHSFNIIGSYGTGKSSFIWALEQHLNSKESYFSDTNKFVDEVDSFEYLPIIGSYESISGALSEILGCKEGASVPNIIKAFSNYYDALRKKNKGLFIAIDEFGKFLEYATKNNPENELYFIQLLAEYINNFDNKIIFITALHQGFISYSYGLSRTQINEWDKVKGRFKEITFNEPVEQLLLLASKRLNSVSENPNLALLFEEISNANIFPLNDYFNIEFAKSIQPFDILSAAILTKALQRYGQNERSLFQFIDTDDYLGLNDFDKLANPFYNIACVYDYLIHNNYSFITSKYNPDYIRWTTINTSLDRVRSIFPNENEGYKKLVKTIGLLNVLGGANGIIDNKFLGQYAMLSLGIENGNEIIDDLETYKIISYSRYYNRYRLVGGTDVDIEAELLEAQIEDNENLNSLFHRNISLPYILAKEHFYETGTPRFFSFKLTQELISAELDEVDGIINIIFSNEITEEEIRLQSLSTPNAILYCRYNDSDNIRKLLIDIEKIKTVIHKYRDDSIVQDDLKTLLQDNQNKLTQYITDYIVSDSSGLNWYFQGTEVNIHSHKSLNRVLSQICNNVYNGTPIQQNELINKSKLSGPIQTARKYFLEALINHTSDNNLGFPDDKFPPQKTIYLTLLRATGIHNNGLLQRPNDQSYDLLWEKCNDFLQEAKVSKVSPIILVERLKEKPFRLKQGFIDFWLPVFLYINKDEFALFQDGFYIPDIDLDALDIIAKKPHLFEIKTFDVSGIKLELYKTYQEFLNIEENENVTNESLIEIIKPFLVFYATLPDYSKKTKRLSKNAILFREAIKQAKDPEKTFFEEIPTALGYNLSIIAKEPAKAGDFIRTLQSYVKEIRTSYEELINRIERFIITEFIGKEQKFPDYRTSLQQRLKNIKNPMLTPKQTIFHQRLMSNLDVRNAWIASLGQALVGKSLDVIEDRDESILYERLKDIMDDLDNLCTLAKSDIDLKHEDLFKLEITTFSKGHQKKILRIPKDKLEQISGLEKDIRNKLTSDKSTNIALLAKLLQEQIGDE